MAGGGAHMDRITITCPDDWHLHLRDGEVLPSVVPLSAAQFRRAIIMPNLKPPITTTAMAEAYRQRILAALAPGQTFEPLMTLYLTDTTSTEEIAAAHRSGLVKAVKLYPAGATTHSDAGVTDIARVDPALAAMAELGMPLLVHGEVTAGEVDIFDREKVFIDTVLTPILERHQSLRVVLEHATTSDAVAFVRTAADRVAATITPHHLLLNRNAIFAGGLRPHSYCLPVLKREQHRQALVEAATSGETCFFAGTDSAPHAAVAKESACGCAGIFSAHAALPLYAEVFDEAGAIDRLEQFAAGNGPDFYRLPRNQDRVTLVREEWTVPESYPFGSETVVPLRAGEKVAWKAVRVDG
jgi:dihydroorotase